MSDANIYICCEDEFFRGAPGRAWGGEALVYGGEEFVCKSLLIVILVKYVWIHGG